MRKRSRLFIGTSGWHYKDWKGTVYPPDLPSGEYLRYYAREFGTVELNNSFYRLPDVHAARLWFQAVPNPFLFAVKANRFLTHIKRLKDVQEPLKRFLRWADRLKNKLGPILFQLPPHWGLNLERLETFAAQLPRHYDFTMEFRDPSWFTEDVYRLLKRYGLGLCMYDREGQSSPQEVTSNMIYVRFHGPEPRYHGSYSHHALQRWADTMNVWLRQGKTVYAYFNNDYEGNAVKNAHELSALLI